VVVLHDANHARHLIIRGGGYEPGLALLDGELLRTLPRRPLVAAALDALSHTLEALWVHGASRFTDALAFAAARTIRECLPRLVHGGDDAARQAMIEASAIANLACGNSGLGLVHALTSAPSVSLPHGYQNGILLPHVAAFNADSVRDAVGRELEELPRLYEQIAFPTRFSGDELGSEGANAMVQAALQNPFRQNNCRFADEPALREVLAGAMAPVAS
jgi:alcohol dehydrogenase class IV